jgi:hypothetical protein
MSGWEEFENRKWTSLWGLIIVTSGGFRFHHTPQKKWLDGLFRNNEELPKEITIFIRKEKIISAVYVREEKWLTRFLFSIPNKLIIRYQDNAGDERELLLESEYQLDDIAGQLAP